MRPALALAALLSLLAAAALAIGNARLYRNDALRIRAFEVPRGWSIAPQTAYPRVVVTATSPDGAKLTLAVQPVRRGATPLQLAAEAATALERQRYRSPRPRADGDLARLDATAPDGRLLRQVYIVDHGLAYVATVAAPPDRPRALRDFEDAVGSLSLLPAAEQIPDGGVLSDGG